jgi:hypothetical protein
MGRPFTPADLVGTPVVLISERLREMLFAQHFSPLGSTLTIDKVPHTIIGVMAKDFVFPLLPAEVTPEPTLLWRILHTPLPSSRESHSRRYMVVARAFGVYRSETLSGQLAHIPLDDSATVVRASVSRAGEASVARLRPGLNVALACAGLLHLIALVTITLNLIRRYLERRADLRTLVALGAPPHRLFITLATPAVIAGVAAVAGVLLAAGPIQSWLSPILSLAMPAHADLRPRVDALVLGGTATTAAIAVVILVPVLAMTRWCYDGASATAVRRVGLVSRALLVLETALCVAVLVTAGLLSLTFHRLITTDRGFNAAGTLVVDLDLGEAEIDDADMEAAARQLIDAVENIPGIDAAAVGSGVPFAVDVVESLVVHTPNGKTLIPAAQVTSISGSYFDVLRIPVLLSSGADRHAVTVDSVLARRLGSDAGVEGAYVQLRGDQSRSIAAVVGSTRQFARALEGVPHVYVPYALRPQPVMKVLARSKPGVNVDPRRVEEAVRQATDPNSAVVRVSSITELLRHVVARERVLALLSAVFVISAALICALSAFHVARYAPFVRARAFAIRAACGARATQLVWRFLKRRSR